MTPLPDHYVTTIRRLLRFAVVWVMVGLFLGVWSTDVNKVVKYGDTARHYTAEERAQRNSPVEAELPPGLMWEAGIDLRLSHGHVILIGAVLPLCFAAALTVVHQAGGGVIGRGTLDAFFWMYAPGALAAMGLIIYKGWYLMSAVRHGNFDLAIVHRDMFGSPAIKGLAYGLSHSVLAAAVGVIAVALWRSIGKAGQAPGATP